MEKNEIYSEKNIQSLVNELLNYLDNNEAYNGYKLSSDVLVYALNKRFYVDEDKCTYKYKNTPIHVDENIDVKEWVKYYNEKALTFTMDSILCEYLYYRDIPDYEKVANKVEKIFSKHGFLIDFGSSTIVFAWVEGEYPNSEIS